MNPTILIRCVAATLAATTLLTAQSAPVARPRSQEPKAEAKASDRMQVRLAEVIAMLEEDDLTPEQRAQAKKKLQEIVAKLRETPAAPTAPAAPDPVRARVREHRPAEAVEGLETIEATPTPSRRPRTFTVRSAEGGEVEVMVAPQEPAAPPQAPKPAKAPKAPKAPKPAKPDALELPAVIEFVDVTEGGEKQPKVYRMKVGEGAVELKEAGEWREVVETIKERAKADQLRAATVRAEAEAKEPKVLHLQAEPSKTTRGLKIVQGEKAHAEFEKVFEPAKKPMVMERDAYEARSRAERAEIEAKRAQETEKRVMREAEAQTRRTRTRVVEEREVEEPKPAARSRIFRAVETDKAGENKVIEVAPLRGALSETRLPRAKVADDEDDDAEIKQLIEEMRAEMREIRKLIQQLRQSQTSAAPRAGAQGLFGRAAAGTPGTANSRPGFSRPGVGDGATAPNPASGAGQGTTNLRWSTKAPAAGAAGGDVLLQVNDEQVDTKAQALQAARSQYEQGVRSFQTKWLSNGQVVDRTYQAPIR